MSKQEITNENYHSKKEYLSASGLKQFSTSPLQYDTYIKSKFVSTPAMHFGSAVHDRIESYLKKDPHIFFDKYVYLEKLERLEFGSEVNRRTKAYKEWKAQEIGSKIPVSENIEKIKDRLFSIYKIRNLLNMEGSFAEPSYFNDFIEINRTKFDVKSKLRADFLNGNKGFFVDYKTISKAPTERNCMYAINDFKYYFQVGFYSALFETIYEAKITNFYFIFIQSSEPFDINVVALTEQEVKNCQWITANYVSKFEEYINKKPNPNTIYEENGINFYSLPNHLYNY